MGYNNYCSVIGGESVALNLGLCKVLEFDGSNYRIEPVEHVGYWGWESRYNLEFYTLDERDIRPMYSNGLVDIVRLQQDVVSKARAAISEGAKEGDVVTLRRGEYRASVKVEHDEETFRLTAHYIGVEVEGLE